MIKLIKVVPPNQNVCFHFCFYLFEIYKESQWQSHKKNSDGEEGLNFRRPVFEEEKKEKKKKKNLVKGQVKLQEST